MNKRKGLNFLKNYTGICRKIDGKNNYLASVHSRINTFFNSAPSNNESRFNDINLQMLSDKLYKQIFGIERESYAEDDIVSIKKELTNFGITVDRAPEIPSPNILLPNLHGSNIEQHFTRIAHDQVKPYLNIINKMVNASLPPIPTNFILEEGWTRYTKTGAESVEYPEEESLVFDVEVCIKSGPLPTLAVAVSPTSWYSWVSKHLIEGTVTTFTNKILTPNDLIPLESTKSDKGSNLNKFQKMPKLVVGHNVSYDRIRVKEQYWLHETATRFLDTMSLHVSVSGTSSYQRAALKSKSFNEISDQLQGISSLNNLVDVYKLYCGVELDKTKRDIFINGDLNQIKEQFNESMMYCALDVLATHKVLTKIFPIFLERFPHHATLAGMLELGSAYLPVNYNWTRYLEEAETTFQDLNVESKNCLSKRADQVCRLLIDDKFKKDPWMWNEDWSIKQLHLKKGYEKIYLSKCKVNDENNALELNTKFKYLNETKEYLPKRIPHMPGYPNWYRKLCEKQNDNISAFPKTQKISILMQITPKLLNLTWETFPLHYKKEYGWGFLIPCNDNTNDNTGTKLLISQYLIQSKTNKIIIYKNEGESNIEEIPNESDTNVNYRYFIKLPHKDGINNNVGNPLAKDFLTKFSENTLAGVDMRASRIVEISKMTSYWKNNRDRILSQLVIWLDNYQQNKSAINYGAIIPQVIVCGTLTRRAVESTWMTASNAQIDRIGSELRAMINAPLNYSIVGADVDSQELWIASIIGDAFSKNLKIQGSTPFSWMTLIGNKSQGTDMHSVTAKAIGISRDQAKVINYARIYGAGQRFAERLLKQFNPTMSDKDAVSKSKKMFQMTKGQKLYQLKQKFISESFIDKLYTANEAFQIAQLHGKSRNEVFEKGKWVGGSESAMFNSLEEIAGTKEPKTPFLNSRLSRALENDLHEQNLPTKVNWVVQSSAVDFLHLILVNMRWLMKDKARLCLSFHDEVRYLVPSKYKYNAAVAMHITNLMVRSFFVSRLKMKDLPMSVAFFATVEVDTALRKEATQDCRTPSNPHGLQEGYGIHNGESLNIWAAIEKSKGCVGMLTNNPK